MKARIQDMSKNKRNFLEQRLKTDLVLHIMDNTLFYLTVFNQRNRYGTPIIKYNPISKNAR